MKFYLTLFLAFCFSTLSAQKVINLNPDPKGEPWYVGNLRKLTAEDYRKIEQTPKLTLQKNYKKGSLPSTVDNSLNKYFRPIFNQENGSCGQASGVGYNFTYAINYARDFASDTSSNQYPTHYTYNFLNDGVDNGSFYFDGWELINANGCPNVNTYGGMSSALTTWMSGYDNYYAAMQNRTLEVFTIDVSTPEGLETLKQWMNDQMNGSSVGGLANFSAGVSGNFKIAYLPSGTPDEGKKVITYWDRSVNHAMTFVGYNDNIKYDFNGDGQYTNNIDIDGNGVVDMRDWEVGALIMANSWGTYWGNSGKAYVPYRLLAEPYTNGGIGSSIVHVIRAKGSYSPKVTLKATITHNSRNKLRITAGISSNLNATRPDFTLQLPIFNLQGGAHYMKGGTTESDKTIEIGLDITPLLSEISSNSNAKFFLVVEEKDPSGSASGSIGSFSVIDYTNGQEEVVCPQSNVPIENNDTTFLSVNQSITFDKVQVSTSSLPDATEGLPYSYTLSAQNGTSPYQWGFEVNYSENISSSLYIPINNNSLTPGGNDDDFASVTLPFEFPFYNKSYSKIKVSTDGSILFGDNFEYVRDQAGLISAKAITVYGSDLMLYPNDGDGIWYFASRDSVVIRWRTSKYDLQSFNADFSATLFPSGKIKFNYGNGITESTDWVAGISNGDGISYCKAKISGSNVVTSNYQSVFNTPSFPDGLEINSNGVISFTPKQGNKDWTVTAKVTDLNKISSKKTFILHSVKSLTFSPDTLRFDSSTNPDPWTEGKGITITNSSLQDLVLTSIDWEGLGWSVSNNALTYPYILSAGSSLTLNIKLKSSITKSISMVWDTMKIQTSNFNYSLPILINPSIYNSSVYPVSFSITNNKGAIEGAKILIDRLSQPIITNNEGIVSVSLPNGSYDYTISFKDYYPISGTFKVNGASQTINLSMISADVESEINDDIHVFPNPFKNELSITATAGSKIDIYNIIGNSIISIKSTNQQENIDTYSLPKGIYILVIEDRKGMRSTHKIVKN